MNLFISVIKFFLGVLKVMEIISIKSLKDLQEPLLMAVANGLTIVFRILKEDTRSLVKTSLLDMTWF